MTTVDKQTYPDGVQSIDDAVWEVDWTGTLNLRVHGPHAELIHCWMTLRPAYCDRGHLQLNIDGPIGLDHQDSFPRYFFSFEEADNHCRTFLKWRLWKHRTHYLDRSLFIPKEAG